MGPRAGLDVWRKEKSFVPMGIQNPDRLARSVIATPRTQLPLPDEDHKETQTTNGLTVSFVISWHLNIIQR